MARTAVKAKHFLTLQQLQAPPVLREKKATREKKVKQVHLVQVDYQVRQVRQVRQV